MFLDAVSGPRHRPSLALVLFLFPLILLRFRHRFDKLAQPLHANFDVLDRRSERDAEVPGGDLPKGRSWGHRDVVLGEDFFADLHSVEVGSCAWSTGEGDGTHGLVRTHGRLAW